MLNLLDSAADAARVEIDRRVNEWLEWVMLNCPTVNFITGVQFDLNTVYAGNVEYSDGEVLRGYDSYDWLRAARKFESDVYDERFGWFYHDAVPDVIDLVEMRRKHI